MSFMLLRFLIIPFHKSYTLLSPHTDTKVVQILIGNSVKCCAKQIVNNASTEMMSFSWIIVLFFFFFSLHFVSRLMKSFHVQLNIKLGYLLNEIFDGQHLSHLIYFSKHQMYNLNYTFHGYWKNSSMWHLPYG